MLSQGQTSRSVNFVFHHRSQSIRTPLQLTRNVRHIIITDSLEPTANQTSTKPAGPHIYLHPAPACHGSIRPLWLSCSESVTHSGTNIVNSPVAPPVGRVSHEHAFIHFRACYSIKARLICRRSQEKVQIAPVPGSSTTIYMEGSARQNFCGQAKANYPARHTSGTPPSLAQYWRPPTRVKFDPLLMPTARASDGVRTVS